MQCAQNQNIAPGVLQSFLSLSFLTSTKEPGIPSLLIPNSSGVGAHRQNVRPGFSSFFRLWGFWNLPLPEECPHWNTIGQQGPSTRQIEPKSSSRVSMRLATSLASAVTLGLGPAATGQSGVGMFLVSPVDDFPLCECLFTGAGSAAPVPHFSGECPNPRARESFLSTLCD